MSETENITEQQPDQLSDILLVLNKEKMKIEAVKGIGKNGELETVEADKKNQNQFMRVDKHGDLFSNFFSNFISQLKNPTNFSFFKVPSSLVTKATEEIKSAINDPSEKGKEVLSKYEVTTEQTRENKQQNQSEMETPATPAETSEYRYKVEDIDWKTMTNLGLSQEKLEKMKVLDDLLKGFKTNILIPISFNLGTAITRMDARLSLQKDQEGKTIVAIHGIRKAPYLDGKFFGHEFTKEDKENLLKTGNMGRVVDLDNTKKPGEKIPSIISIDKLTNEVIALRADRMKVPDEYKGVKLNDEQKQTIMEGKPLYLEGMISQKGEPFNGNIQYNAEKRYIQIFFDDKVSIDQTQTDELSRVFRGKELTDEQYNKLKNGETVYVDGLFTSNQKEYQGYINLNKETGKVDFSFKNGIELKDPSQKQAQKQSEGSKQDATEKTGNKKQPKRKIG